MSPPDPGFLLDSSEHQPQQSQQPTLVSVSTTFFPGAGLDSSPEDLVILSSDSVFFYCHSTRLLAASDNGFNGLLRAHIKHNPTDFDSGQIHSFPDDSTVLNVVLHTIYSMSCSHYSPSHNTIQEAVAAMVRYGISLKAYIAPSSPLSSLFLANAAHNPLEIYAIAASFDLYELAASISVHLLSIPLCNITDELAIKIGPVYLRRLFFLHLGRIDALKRLLVSPPLTHEPTQECDLTDQKRVTRAWALASAYLAWDARPGMSLSTVDLVSFFSSDPTRSVDGEYSSRLDAPCGSLNLRALQTFSTGAC